MNLAEVHERISSLEGLSNQRRQDLMSAVRQVARLLGGHPADFPADPEALRRKLAILTPASASMSRSRWANVRALLGAALELTGAKVVRKRRFGALSPSWRDLLKQVGDPMERIRLSRFFTFASAKGVAPEQVNDQVVLEFAEDLERHSLVNRHKQVVRGFCLAWNRWR